MPGFFELASVDFFPGHVLAWSLGKHSAFSVRTNINKLGHADLLH